MSAEFSFSRRRRQHDYVLPLTVSKRYHISVYQLYIARSINQLAIELRTVRTLQINQVRLHFVRFVAILISDSLEAELNHCAQLAYIFVCSIILDSPACCFEMLGCSKVKSVTC